MVAQRILEFVESLHYLRSVAIQLERKHMLADHCKCAKFKIKNELMSAHTAINAHPILSYTVR